MNSSSPTAWIFSIMLFLVSLQAWAVSNSMPAPDDREAIAHSATVLETMSTAGYTYIRVEEDGIKFWIALPETEVSVGETISFYEQMLMENFTSKSLNRTFDRILFVEAINKGTVLPSQAGAMSSPHEQPPRQQTESQQSGQAESPQGRFTVSEIFRQKDTLAGKVVEVKGRVTKVSAQIMGRDWVHIEDGSGTTEGQNNKLIFRSLYSNVAVDDVVVASGVLFVNRDFGYGYFYPVIVEDAVFSK